MNSMTMKRLAELEKTLESADPTQPVRTDVFEMRQLLALARRTLEREEAE